MIGGNDEREQTLNQLLAQIDGFDTAKGVILLAATNRPEILDAALAQAASIVRSSSTGRPERPGDDPQGPQPRCEKDAVDMTDFDAALDRVVGGLERRSRVSHPKEQEILAHHEAGHTPVAESRAYANKVTKISIIPGGVAALGYTEQQPTEDRYLMMRAELFDRLDVMLGRRVAEELIFGDVSTGAQDDLQRATDMARHMVAQYGMSDELGLATFEQTRQARFLGVDRERSGRSRNADQLLGTPGVGS